MVWQALRLCFQSSSKNFRATIADDFHNSDDTAEWMLLAKLVAEEVVKLRHSSVASQHQANQR